MHYYYQSSCGHLVKMRSRGYCYTLNNYTEDEETTLKAIDCKYHVFGKEVGEKGTPHLQGFIYFVNKKSLKQLSKLIPRAHLESVKGTPSQAAKYCKKDGIYWESGDVPDNHLTKKERNKRLRDVPLNELVDSGELSMYQVRAIKNARLDLEEEKIIPKTLDHLSNEWYYGESGTGKSRKARKENPEAYIKNCNKWWCGYKGEDTVIIDEFSPNHAVLASHLKVWADHYPFRAEVKGASKMVRPKKFIVTSNYHPSQIFEKEEDIGPILRRFKITHFNKQL